MNLLALLMLKKFIEPVYYVFLSSRANSLIDRLDIGVQRSQTLIWIKRPGENASCSRRG